MRSDYFNLKLICGVAPILSLIFYTPMNAQSTKFFVGTTNGETVESLALCALDEQQGTLTLVDQLKAGKRPGYITVWGDILYAVSTDSQGEDENTLRAFRIQNDDLQMISEVSSKGINPCYISVGGKGESLYSANYTSGSITQYALKPDGSIGENWYFQQFEGSSINPTRQTSPHAHYINTTRDNKFALTADLGTDKVMIHEVDNSGRLQRYESQPSIALPPGSGPRHLDFHENNRWIYVLNELNSTITTVDYKNGSFKVLSTISTLPADFEGESYPAAVRIHPEGKYVYSSNRGADNISVFEIAKNGELKLVQNFGEPLGWVRDFNITPSGKFLVAGNEKTDQIVLLKLGTDGRIDKHISTLDFPSPSCFVFLK